MQNEEALNSAAKQLNTDPSKLKEALESGNFQKAVGKMSKIQQEQLNRALTDKEYAQKILSSPQAQALMKKLMK